MSHTKVFGICEAGCKVPVIPASESCMPNLLINSDFKSGIINQRGLNQYVGVTNKITYTIDMWFIGAGTSEIILNNDFIAVKLQGKKNIGQFIEHDISGVMTLSIKLKDENEKAFTLSNYSNVDGNLKYVFGNVLNDISIQVNKYSVDEKWQLMILNNSTSVKTLNIEYIKLEKGSAFTGMPTWDKDLETFKCQSKFYKLQNNSTEIRLPCFAKSADTVMICLDLPNFIDQPMVTVGLLYVVQIDDGVWRQLVDITSINWCRNKVIIEMKIKSGQAQLNVQKACYLRIEKGDGHITVNANKY